MAGFVRAVYIKREKEGAGNGFRRENGSVETSSRLLSVLFFFIVSAATEAESISKPASLVV